MCSGCLSARVADAQATLVAFVNWLSAQLRRPSNPARSVPAAVGALASLLREKPVRQLFTRNGAQLRMYSTDNASAPSARIRLCSASCRSLQCRGLLTVHRCQRWNLE